MNMIITTFFPMDSSSSIIILLGFFLANVAGAFLSPLPGAYHHQQISAFNTFETLLSRPLIPCPCVPESDIERGNLLALRKGSRDDDDREDEYDGAEPIAVTIDPNLSDEKLKALFSWIKCAYSYGESDKNDDYAYYYNNIEMAIAAVFGNNLPKNSLPSKLLEQALKEEGLLVKSSSKSYSNGKSLSKEWEEELIGQPIGRRERESASLGAMGAAQWSGRWMTRPHSLLNVQNYTSVDDWVKTLPRGCKRTLKKATPELQNFTISSKPIRGGHPAPHSSYAHFRCVVQHEVRLLSSMYGDSIGAFVNALAEAIGRYMGTTRMAGNIWEYRDVGTDDVIGFAHEVSKGRTIRGQWFYCDDDAATRYVWFHSVYDLVRRAIADPHIDVVDLGPSGSDSFTELKDRYGFKSVVDWPAFADYSGEFNYGECQNEKELGDDMIHMIEKLLQRQAARESRRKDVD